MLEKVLAVLGVVVLYALLVWVYAQKQECDQRGGVLVKPAFGFVECVQVR